MPDEILVIDHVEKRFGGLVAVSVEHLAIERNRITALIGPNGAGKTTLFNQLTGFDKPDSGRVSFDGVEIAGAAPNRVVHAGLVRTFQLTKVLARMTVLDNLKLGAPNQRGERAMVSLFSGSWRGQEREIEAKADVLLERFNLQRVRDEFAGTLSGGQRKLLEMARALMVDPKMVLLDEPMAGVNPALVDSILVHIRELRDEGLTVMFVEHDMDVVMGISDTVVCMAEGRVIAAGTPSDVVADPGVRAAYLGIGADAEADA
jgi:branched-chain amino acid transport system ATP-binding protein